MKKNTAILVGVIALVVISGGLYAVVSGKGGVMVDKKMDDSALMKGDEMMKEKETIMAGEEMDKSEVTMKGSYEAYSAEKLSRAETGDVVLFFHASWCPSCRSLSSDIETNADAIPEGVSILKVDYDKETELKKRYGVTSQHTLVQVDKEGNLIKKWSGSPKLSSLLSQIQ